MNLLLIVGFILQDMCIEFLYRDIPIQIHRQFKFTDNPRSALLREFINSFPYNWSQLK